MSWYRIVYTDPTTGERRGFKGFEWTQRRDEDTGRIHLGADLVFADTVEDATKLPRKEALEWCETFNDIMKETEIGSNFTVEAV